MEKKMGIFPKGQAAALAPRPVRPAGVNLHLEVAQGYMDAYRSWASEAKKAIDAESARADTAVEYLAYRRASPDWPGW